MIAERVQPTIAETPRGAPLRLGTPGDVYEQEADRIANALVGPRGYGAPRPRMEPGVAPRPPLRLSRAQTGAPAGAVPQPAFAPPIVNQVVAGQGEGLDSATQRVMEAGFGHDFSMVRVHHDAMAAQSAVALRANAYTVGQRIAFGPGKYAPGTRAGQWLLAHELTHVVQQAGADPGIAQRDCSDSDFCTAYPTTAEADDAEWWIRHTYLPLEGIPTFGTEAGSLYERFLDRSPGDSLAPVVFDNPASYLVTAFSESGDTTDDMDAVIEMVGNRLSMAPGGALREGVRTVMSLSNFLSASEMDNRPINYSNPFSVAGHIAGGIGSSDAGDDYRKITRANVALEKTTLIGSTGYVSVELIPHYEVFDAIDFCPGDCGSSAEQVITVPMSRLEKSGAAYDVPFKVIFSPEPRSERFWF